MTILNEAAVGFLMVFYWKEAGSNLPADTKKAVQDPDNLQPLRLGKSINAIDAVRVYCNLCV